MVSDSLVNRIFEAARQTLAESIRRPVTTYRLQFNRSLTFAIASHLTAYLHSLGITDCYASPYLKARPGSLHGYDITDHNALNPEIGSWKEYRRFVDQLRRHGMAQLLDFVPNHMGMFDNPWWQDVLENGPSSPHARFFDIDWNPVKAELRRKVLLPILEDLYGKVLSAGGFRLTLDGGAFSVIYRQHRLPVDSKTTVPVLERCLEKLKRSEGRETPEYLELQSVITACNNLPSREEVDTERASERQREKEIIKKRLASLGVKKKLKGCLDETVKEMNAGFGAGTMADELHQLLEAQAYRLSYWRVAAEEINYRRFFDINELVALRMEDPRCFEESHRLLGQLLREGLVSGIRVDHIDGLLEPQSYLQQLQRSYFLDLCQKKEVEGRLFLTERESASLAEGLAARWKRESEQDPSAAVARPLYVVVEKILAGGEKLREPWPVYGTTGYEFATALNGVFVDSNNERALLNIYRQFAEMNAEFPDIVYQSKDLVMKTSLAAELNVLAHQLNRLSEKSRWYRDFTLNSLRDALREVVACFPVYRTYIRAANGPIDERDETVIKIAVGDARSRNPAISAAIFDFVRDTLLLQYPADMSEEGRREQQLFAMRFQQLTGPVMAKGMEDTAFYIYNPLVSMNEVGGNPQRFGVSPEEFHQQNLQRHRSMPHSLVTTSTHDSKRSEDVRARINVLSEMPRQWRSALARWSRLNGKSKTELSGAAVPDKNEEYFLYQTLLGTYPLQDMDEKERGAYCRRIQEYMLKATREAKTHTSWVSPNLPHEEALLSFISSILDPSTSSAFIASFSRLHKLVADHGMYNSLSQVLLKTFSPGAPDVYQGNELWDFSLVDPDNRRPVDFERRALILSSLKLQAATASDLPLLAGKLQAARGDGRIKLFLTWKSLAYRRDSAGLFAGSYVPLEAGGTKMAHVCAFAWQTGDRELIVIAPRLIFGLVGNSGMPPTGPQVWEDTCILLPRHLRGKRYRNIFTGETVGVASAENQARLSLSAAFSIFPVAALERV